jgi:hypothetical protein
MDVSVIIRNGYFDSTGAADRGNVGAHQRGIERFIAFRAD